MKYVVDASVCIKWYVPEIYESEADRLLGAHHIFHVPDLVFPEFCNIVGKKVQRGELTAAEGELITHAFTASRLHVHAHAQTIDSAYTGAILTGQTVYDWTYLALAVSLSCELVTADHKFYQALVPTPVGANLKWIGDG